MSAPAHDASVLSARASRGPVTLPQRIRILGIDPGLRVTGFGVIERVGQKLCYVTSGCIRTPDAELPRASEGDPRRPERGHRRASARAGRGRESVRQRQSAVHAAARPGARRRDLRRGRVRAAGLGIHRAAGQTGRGRQRPRREGAGAGDGAPAARTARAIRARTRPMRWRAPSAMRTAARASERWPPPASRMRNGRLV